MKTALRPALFRSRRAGAAALFALALSTPAMSAEIRPARLDDSPVPSYTLPDPLVGADGAKVADVTAWETQRRPELLELFAREIYGRTPDRRDLTLTSQVTSDDHALGGRATRKQITVWFTADRSGPAMHVLLYIPRDGTTRPRPAFLGLNFYGNHTVHADPGIRLATEWIPAGTPGVVDGHATAAARGSDAAKWPIDTVLARGFAIATVYCGDLCPDRPEGLADGIGALFSSAAGDDRAPDAWGAIGCWAWGLSRALDVLTNDRDIDASRVAVHGHSRLGKAALWAGAQDQRFALVISNESGCGGAALSKRLHGETVARINAVFPHWFARNFRRYNDNEAALPVDQHELLALIAPRPLHVASAEDDDWADPRGEFLAAQAVAPVYALWRPEGVGVTELPPVHQPVGDRVRYHIRTGAHGMTSYDWSCYLDTADRFLGATR